MSASPTARARHALPASWRRSGARAPSGRAPGTRAHRPSTRASGRARCRPRPLRRRAPSRLRSGSSWPGTRSVPTRRTNSRKRSHSSDGARPAPMPVFRITSRATRSGSFDREPQPDRPAPVLDDDRRLAQVELVGETLDRLVVEVVRVVLDPGRLVGAAEAEIVGRDRARDTRRSPGSSSGTGTPTSARHGAGEPDRRSPRRRSASAARPARRNARRTNSREDARSVRRVCDMRPSLQPMTGLRSRARRSIRSAALTVPGVDCTRDAIAAMRPRSASSVRSWSIAPRSSPSSNSYVASRIP